MKKLTTVFLSSLIFGFSLPVNADTTKAKCTIDPTSDVVFCKNNKDNWRCVNVAAGEWSCEGKLTSWTTDCPYCEAKQ